MYETAKRAIIIAAVIIGCVAIGTGGGWVLGDRRADERIAELHRESESRIGTLERKLEESRNTVGELGEENKRLRADLGKIEVDRERLEEVNREYDRIIGLLRSENNELRRAIEDSQGRLNSIDGLIGGVEGVLQEIREGSKNQGD